MYLTLYITAVCFLFAQFAFEDLSFVSQSLTNAISLLSVYSISSKHLFIAVSDFGAEKTKKNLKPDTSGSIFPTTPRQRSNPHPREGLTNQIPHSPGTENDQTPGVCPEWGGDVQVSIWSAHKYRKSYESECIS